MSTFPNTFKAKRGPYSPHLIGYWKCTDGTADATTKYVKDYSGNGHDLSPLNAPTWRANSAVVTGKICTPTTPNGFYYEVTAVGTTAATEPSWPVIAGNTVTDGGVLVWTCRAVPTTDMWGSRSDWLQATGPAVIGTNPGVAFCAKSLHHAIRETFQPTVTGNIDYRAGTISGTVTANHIDDSASGFPSLTIGDWIWISGFTGATANNTMARVSASSAAQISMDKGGITSNDSAGETVRIRKILKPPSIALSFWMNSTASTGNAYLLCEMNEMWGTSRGRTFLTTATRRFTSSFQDITDTTVGGSSAVTTGQQVTTNTDTHWVIVLNVENNSLEYYKNGTRDSGAILTLYTALSRQLCQGADLTTMANAPYLSLLRPQTTTDGRVQIRDVQLYVGRDMPGGMYGSPTPTLINQLYGGVTPGSGVPLSNTDWP